MIIELLDGPLKGYIHEVEMGFPMPDAVALPDENGVVCHCYERINGEWRYTMTEAMGTSTNSDW